VVSEARVFNFSNELFASYFRATGSSSGVVDSAYGDSSGTGTTVQNKPVQYDFSGEIGILMSIEEIVNFRVGIEVISPKNVTGLVGSRTSDGAKYFDLDSKILVINPNVTFEVNFMNTMDSRFFVFGGAGLANISLDNTYTMTATGVADLVPTHTEKIESNQISGHAGFGYEIQTTDNITTAFELGYRYLYIGSLKYKHAVNTITGNKAKGSVARTDSNLRRVVNMSAPYFGISLRFYLNVL